MLDNWQDALGLLSVALAVLAAVIYIAQTLRGEVRPSDKRLGAGSLGSGLAEAPGVKLMRVDCH